MQLADGRWQPPAAAGISGPGAAVAPTEVVPEGGAAPAGRPARRVVGAWRGWPRAVSIVSAVVVLLAVAAAAAPTTAAPAAPPATAAPRAVTAPAGATGVSAAGVPMSCATAKCDGTPYGQPRWRRAAC